MYSFSSKKCGRSTWMLYFKVHLQYSVFSRDIIFVLVLMLFRCTWVHESVYVLCTLVLSAGYSSCPDVLWNIYSVQTWVYVLCTLVLKCAVQLPWCTWVHLLCTWVLKSRLYFSTQVQNTVVTLMYFEYIYSVFGYSGTDLSMTVILMWLSTFTLYLRT